ncbi:hypothetical protein DFJ73DRAFT_793640 [Zopfochytrium polystomum]|nr:hypothetical protein DFJ73DRAFT_793640 [Zopfochytrium polystomum]
MTEIIEYLVADRLSLRTQNEQMWKIIEKQRAIVHQLQGQVSESVAEESTIRAAVAAASDREDRLNRDMQERSESFSRLELDLRTQLKSSNDLAVVLQKQAQEMQGIILQQQQHIQRQQQQLLIIQQQPHDLIPPHGRRPSAGTVQLPETAQPGRRSSASSGQTHESQPSQPARAGPNGSPNILAQKSSLHPPPNHALPPTTASSASNTGASISTSPQPQDSNSNSPNQLADAAHLVAHTFHKVSPSGQGPLPARPPQQPSAPLHSSQVLPNGSSPPAAPSSTPHVLSAAGSLVTVIATTFHNKDMISFTVEVRLATGESWRVQKLYGDLVLLDSKLRKVVGRQQQAKMGKLPDKALVFSLNPAKNEAKRTALELYIQTTLAAVSDLPDIVEFLTTSAIQDSPPSVLPALRGPVDVAPPSRYVKEGYLSKKGKSFGGWKSRYLKVSPSALEYYETPASRDVLGVIQLEHCLVFRGNPSIDSKHRHSLVVIEYRPGSFQPSSSGVPELAPQDSRILNRHTFSAETDDDRDGWLGVLAARIADLRPGYVVPTVLSGQSQTSQQFVPVRQPQAEGFVTRSGGQQSFTDILPPPLSMQRDLSQQQIFQQLFLQHQQIYQSQEAPQLPALSPSQQVSSLEQLQQQLSVPQQFNQHSAQLAASPENHEAIGSFLGVVPQPSTPLSQSLPESNSGLGVDLRDFKSESLPNQLSKSLPPPPTTSGNLAVPSVYKERRSSRNAEFLKISSPGGPLKSPAGPDTSSSSIPTDLPRSPMATSPSARISVVPPKREPRRFVDDSTRIMEQNPPPLPPLDQSGWGQSAQSKKGGATKKLNGIAQWGKRKTLDNRIDPNRRVFGLPLDQAVEISRLSDYSELPAVVYRCIEYLEARNAKEEEGIYRLSGSNATIQSLKHRFNTEGDVDLLASEEQYDVHAIAGLLKLYLRELPSTVLTKHHQRDFIKITEITDRDDRITELSRQASALPLPNYTLLSCLIAHLIRIVQCADRNKMSFRNVGIVFSPTLGVPANIMTLMLAEYELVFCWDDPVKASAAKEREREMLERRAAAAVVAAATAGKPSENGSEGVRAAAQQQQQEQHYVEAGADEEAGAGGGTLRDEADATDLYDLGDYA